VPLPPPDSASGSETLKTEGQKDAGAVKTSTPQEPSRKKWFTKTKKRYINLALKILTLVVGTCLLLQTQKQANTSREAVNVAADALKFQERSDSLNAIAQKAIADSSIALSKQIAETQERFAKIETRAYIVFKEVAKFEFTVGKLMTMDLNFINAGRTPANNMRSYALLKIGTGIYQHEIDAIENGISKTPYLGTLGAGTIFTTAGPDFRTMSKADSADVSSGKSFIYFFGMIRYTDIFGEDHSTRFSFEFIPPASFVTVTRYSKSE
jgi:hypothetical protein